MQEISPENSLSRNRKKNEMLSLSYDIQWPRLQVKIRPTS